MFSGIGAFERSLTNIGIDYELINYCEIDKFAATAYSAIHNVSEELNLGDITKVDLDSLSANIDIITHGSPCTTLSVAGKQTGADKGSGTQSSLMWNTVEIIKHLNPKYVIWENVPNILSDKHKHNYDKYIDTLDKLGYNNYSKIINAKHWGVPQNRERIFVVSIRKDVDKGFKFPISSLEGQIGLFNNVVKIKETILMDILEEEIDEKYKLSDKALEYMNRKVKDGRTHWEFGLHHEADKTSHAIVANIRKGVPYNVVKIPIKTYKDVSNTVKSSDRGSCDIKHTWDTIYDDCIVRHFSPLECWRLMSFEDEDYYKARKALEDKYYNGADRSDSQCYKMAGNSIVVPVLEYIFKELFDRGGK